MTARRVTQAGTTQTPDAMRTLLAHHLSAFQANDLEALMADYTQASILITADATHTGTAEIKAFFAKLIPQFPTLGTRFELDKITVIEDLLFIAWHANTPTVKVSLGSDTFLVKQGKIHRQTFVGQLEPI
jgi:ketosteroid isomerase-like protein